MCDLCELFGQWVCCGGVVSKGERCPECERTQIEDEQYQRAYRGLPPWRPGMKLGGPA
jgi:hypothetical protein